MSKTTSAQIRTRLVLEAFEHHGTLTTFGLARHLKLENPESFFYARKIRHIIGDLTYTGYLVRVGANSRSSGKALPLFRVTDEGMDHLAYLTALQLTPTPTGATPAEVKDETPEKNETFAAQIQQILDVPEIVLPELEPAPEGTELVHEWIEEPVRVVGHVPAGLPSKLSENPGKVIQLPIGRPVATPVSTDTGSHTKIVPPARELPQTPAYPTLGKNPSGEASLGDLDKLAVVYRALRSRDEMQLASLVEIVANNLKRQNAIHAGVLDLVATLGLALGRLQASIEAPLPKAS